MLPEAIAHSPLLGIAITLIAYRFGEMFSERFNLSFLPPLLTAGILIMLTILHTPLFTYEEYNIGASFINFLLGPATVALAMPIVKSWAILKANLRILIAGVLVATATAILSIAACAKLFGASLPVIISMLPKSVTTPIAIDISKTLGGIPPLTVACVIFTGIFGAMIGHKLLHLVGVKNDISIGLAMGASSHALGTSTCAKYSSLQVAIGSIAIALVGIATALLAPFVLPLVQ